MRKRILLSVLLLIFFLSIPAYSLAEDAPTFTNIFTEKVSEVYVSADFSSDHTLYLFSNNKLFRSQDSGNTWLQKDLYSGTGFNPNEVLTLYDMLCSNNNTIYLSGYNKDRTQSFFIKSTDAGDSWKILQTNAYYSLCSADNLLFGISKSQKFIVSSDNFGVSWNRDLVTNIQLRNYAFTTTDGKSLYTVYNKSLRSTVDNRTWTSVRSLNSDKTKLSSLVDNDKKIIIACNPEVAADVIISYDNGINWETVNFGSDAKILQCKITCATAAPGGYIFLGTANKSILVSEDYGKTWKIISKGVADSVSSIKSAVDGDSVKVFAATSSGLLSLNYHIAGAEEIARINSTVKFTIGKKSFYKGTQNTEMDAVPFTSGDRSFVPIRYLGEALGAEVSWGEISQTVTIEKDNLIVTVPIGKKAIVVNGKEIPMDVKPTVRADRTYLPARYVAEALGYTVDWDSATKTVIMYKK